jgi:mono/diheme cytochrome c family protein
MCHNPVNLPVCAAPSNPALQNMSGVRQGMGGCSRREMQCLPRQTKREVTRMNTKRMKKIIVLLTVCAFTVGYSALAADGAEVYAKNCTKCHGDDGAGKTKMGEKLGCKDYSKEAVDADKAFKSVKEGMKDSGGKTLMKAYGESLSDEEIKAAVEHMKSFKK